MQCKIYALLHTWSSGVPFHSKVTTLKHFRPERCCGLKARRKGRSKQFGFGIS